MTPEQKARERIDEHLGAAGWAVQDHKSMNLAADQGIAVREFPLEGVETWSRERFGQAGIDRALSRKRRCVGH